MDVRVSVDEHALGGEALGAVARDCVAVIEMPVIHRIEFQLAIAFEPCGEPAVRCNGLDDGKVAIGDAK
jgi:hypothetical protein